MTVQQRPRIEGRSGARRARQDRGRGQTRKRPVALAAAAIVVALAVLVAARILTAQLTVTSDGPVSPDVLASATNVPASTFEQVGQGTATALPFAVRDAIRPGPNGLPLITYVGAEYCPFCAAERWSLVVALSRFGEFSDLRASHSAGDDVYPNTPTFSFVGSSFSSPYVDFSAVELQSNVRSGQNYAALQTPTAEQTQILSRYDSPPYVPRSAAGAIPFIDIADQYFLSGASYDVGVLRGQSLASIAQSLGKADSAQARAIVGGANTLTAAICPATGDAPGDVCRSSTIRGIEAKLAGAAAPSGG